jgi:hypothetical protein
LRLHALRSGEREGCPLGEGLEGASRVACEQADDTHARSAMPRRAAAAQAAAVPQHLAQPGLTDLPQIDQLG